MATYKTGPGKASGTAPTTILCPLICEQCFEALGIVRAASGLTGLPSASIAGLWPELASAVANHERVHAPPVLAGAPVVYAAAGQ